MTEIFDDIRKLYLFTAPRPELAEHIEFFSETSLEATRQYIKTETFSVKLFPSFTPTVWLNLGNSYELVSGGKATRIEKSSDVLVLRSSTLERKNFCTDNIFTIKFLPMGFESIFGISQAEIGDGIVKADKILGPSVIKKVKGLASLKERSLFLEAVFIEKLERSFHKKLYVNSIKQAILLFSQNQMGLTLNDVASRLNVSEKTFYRYFHKAVGTNPKDFFLLTRCRQALTAYRTNVDSFSPYDFGYYDNAHFSKDVKRFTGSTLTSQTS